jgi:TonB family protein
MIQFGKVYAGSGVDTVRIYFNADWQPTDSANAEYYEKVWHDNSLWHMNDYFKNHSPKMIATFQDDSLQVKTGSCLLYYDNGRLSEKTNYVNGRLEGPQVWYFPNGQKSEEGVYKADSVVSALLWTEDGLPDPTGVPMIVRPSFDGDMSSVIASNLRYPPEARENGYQGKALISFLITAKGNMAKATVVRSSGYEELDQEALRVVMTLRKWRPGKHHNRPLDMRYTLPIAFKID